MISKTDEGFWRCCAGLPPDIQQQARQRFRLWQEEGSNAALHFKPLFRDVWSVRVNRDYQESGRRKGNLIVWFWMGSHAK